jgi:hypothetical protein
MGSRFSAHYCMDTVTLKELQAVLKVNTQTGQSGLVNETSLESTTLDDDFQEVKRRKRRISNDISETTMKLTNSVPISTAVKQTPKAVSTRNFFAPLRTNDMDMETTGTEKTLPEQDVPRKSSRPPPIVMISTTNLIRLQRDLKEYVKGEYEFRNTRNGTRITTKEMVDYLAIKSYLEKNNLQYLTFYPNSEKPIKATFPQTRHRKIFPTVLRVKASTSSTWGN